MSVTTFMSLPSSSGRQVAVRTTSLEPPSRGFELPVVDRESWEVIAKLTDSKASADVCIRFRSSVLEHVAEITTCFRVSLFAEESNATGAELGKLIQLDCGNSAVRL